MWVTLLLEEGLGTYDVVGDKDAMEVLVDVGAGVGRITLVQDGWSGSWDWRR